MSESKHEIPPAMLDAATAAVFNKNYCSEWAAGRLAEVALQAAGMAEIAARIAELEAELVKVREVLHQQTSYLEGRLRNAMTGEGCPHGCVRPSQCVDCVKERG